MSQLLQAKCLQVRRYLTELREVLARLDGAPEDEILHRALERLVQVVVEAAADAGDMWLGEQGHTLGQSAAGVFHALRRVGVLTGGAGERFVDYASSRNQIVHGYDTLRPDKVRRDAEGLVRDIPDLLKALLAPSDGGGE
jgi:uncharacterized protein YutE (UPF0331/DUF86 family)